MNCCKLYRLLFLLSCVFITNASLAQLSVTAGRTAATLASRLAGPGITITSPVLTCATVANGTFVSVSTPLALDSGIVLTSGRAMNTIGPESFLASTSNGTAGDAALAALAGATTYDACVLEFDFVPTGDTISFNYQFGSEEYINSTCGPYNDAFAFFISGPGITGTQNMALVPGTNIPVTVNSVNSGVPGSGYTLANCTAMGAGSPFTAYYYNNLGGTQLTYRGFTRKMTAIHDVIPCNTYHLKVAVCDAGNRLYDSGVFIEAGSLKTNSFVFDRRDSIGHTILGVPNTIVKGCDPATINVLSAHSSGTAHTVHFTYGGTGVRGTDYTAPDSATIVAGDTTVAISITGLPTSVSGTKTVTIFLQSPFSCGIVDSFVVNIMDTPSAHILTPDTSICLGASFLLRATGTTGLNYSWSPATGLSSTTILSPTASPTSTTTYVLTATLPGSGCTPIVRSVNVTVINTAVTILTPDTTICISSSVNIRVSGSATLSYIWTPVTGLSSAYIPNPVATPTTTTTYSLTTTSGGLCPTTRSLTITVVNPIINILTPDTTICSGDAFQIRANSTSGMTFNWSPATGLSSTSVLQPIASPTITTTYVVTGTSPGCPVVTDMVVVNVVDVPVAIINPDTTICKGASVSLLVAGSSTYAYSWTPGIGLDLPGTQNPIATPGSTTTYSVTATDPTSGCKGHASATITVVDPTPTILTPDTAICKDASIQIRVSGDVSYTYSWTPAATLDNAAAMQPIASPVGNTTYWVTVTATLPGGNCTATKSVTVSIVDLNAYAGPDVWLCPAVPAMLEATPAGGNYGYTWNGPGGYLSNSREPVISNLAGAARGVYTLTVTDNNNGCTSFDTTTVDVYPSTIHLTDITMGQTIEYGKSIQLYVTGAAHYWWSPSDGSLDNPNINNPVATPATPTLYTVRAMDEFGCKDSASVRIDLTYGTVFIADAFTPNGDGLNDRFRVGHLGQYNLVSMSVFNRWGNCVYQDHGGENTGWDGTFNGQPQDMGVYNYLIIVQKPDGSLQYYKGDVTLLR